MSGTNTSNGTSRIKSALDLYERTNKHIDDSVNKQQLKADGNYQRLMKYLPIANKVNGITGGLAESSMLEATVAHQNKLADIAAEGEAQKLTAQKEYDQSVLNAYAENYALASDTIKNWTGSKGELDEYLEGMSGNVSPQQYANLKNYASDVGQTITEQETEEREMSENLILGDKTQKWIKDRGENKYNYGANFTISYNNKEYELEMGNELTDENSGPLKAVKQGKVTGDDKIFVYDDKLYYTREGRVFEVFNRDTTFWGNKHATYENLLAAMKGEGEADTSSIEEHRIVRGGGWGSL